MQQGHVVHAVFGGVLRLRLHADLARDVARLALLTRVVLHIPLKQRDIAINHQSNQVLLFVLERVPTPRVGRTAALSKIHS